MVKVTNSRWNLEAVKSYCCTDTRRAKSPRKKEPNMARNSKSRGEQTGDHTCTHIANESLAKSVSLVTSPISARSAFEDAADSVVSCGAADPAAHAFVLLDITRITTDFDWVRMMVGFRALATLRGCLRGATEARTGQDDLVSLPPGWECISSAAIPFKIAFAIR